MTPPTASEPQIVLFEPRSTSILPAVPSSRLPKSNPPEGLAWSATRTPSIRTSTWSELAPRRLTLVTRPIPPLRDSDSPGTRFNARAGSAPCSCSISSRSMTVTDWPVLRRSVPSPLAVTVITAASRGAAAGA